MTVAVRRVTRRQGTLRGVCERPEPGVCPRCGATLTAPDPGPAPAASERMETPPELAGLYAGETDPLYMWPHPPRGELIH